jgi:hypothetical protein
MTQDCNTTEKKWKDILEHNLSFNDTIRTVRIKSAYSRQLIKPDFVGHETAYFFFSFVRCFLESLFVWRRKVRWKKKCIENLALLLFFQEFSRINSPNKHETWKWKLTGSNNAKTWEESLITHPISAIDDFKRNKNLDCVLLRIE